MFIMVEESKSLYFFDSHLHFQYFNDDQINEIVEKCLDEKLDIKINFFLTNSTYRSDFDRTVKISDTVNSKFPATVIPGIGYHPW